MARLPITSSAAYTIANGQLQQLSSARNRERQKTTRSGEFRQAKQAAKKSTTSAAQTGATPSQPAKPKTNSANPTIAKPSPHVQHTRIMERDALVNSVSQSHQGKAAEPMRKKTSNVRWVIAKPCAKCISANMNLSIARQNR